MGNPVVKTWQVVLVYEKAVVKDQILSWQGLREINYGALRSVIFLKFHL